MRIDQNEARSRFSSARVARLATVSADGLPHIVPVTFAVAADMIYTAIDAKPKTTRDLRRLRNIRHSPRVALLADRYDENPAELTAPVSLLVSRYRQYTQTPPAGPVIAIRVTHWTGWSAG